MVDVFQNHFLSFGVFNLVLFDDVVLVDRLHSEELFRLFPFNEQHGAKSSPSKNYFGGKIFQSYFLLEIFFGEECFCGSPDHLSFFFLPFEVLFIGEIIMHDILSFDFLGPFLFLFLFGGCIMNQTQFILVIDREFVIFDFSISLQDVVNDLLSAVR